MNAPQRSAALQTLRPIPVLSLPTGETIVAQAAAERDFLVETLFASNATGIDAAVALHIIAPGDAPTTANRIMAGRVIAGQQTVAIFDRDAPCLLGPGSALVAVSDTAAAVTVWGHGVDILGAYG